MSPRLPVFLTLICALSLASAGLSGCSGSAQYDVTFYNFLTAENFGSLIPSDGLVFSPLSAVSHSNRVSLLTVRGFASEPVELIAEKGDNSELVAVAESLLGKGTKSVVAADGPTMPGNKTTLRVAVDCENPFVTAISMIAPSPDWIVQVSNKNLFSSGHQAFVPYTWGYLIAYDAGTDSGMEFTNPEDESLDEPTEPPLNIAPLVEDETDRFEGRLVGKYVIEKVM